MPSEIPRALARASSIEDLRLLARKRLPRAVFDYFDGGAEDETTLRDNRAAFERVRLAPRTLIDVERVDTRTEILGRASALPLAISPIGAIGFGWPGADVAVARVAAAHGIPYTLSTAGTASIERIAREAPGRLWFQAYVVNRPEFFARLVERARDADYEALVITVDIPVGGKRERDLRNDFGIPFRFTPRNVLDFASSPSWLLRLLRHGVPKMENLEGFTPAEGLAGASSVGRELDPSFDWDRLQKLRDTWPRKLLVKGVVRPDDAERLAAMGCDGIIVSNHGGRQLDGAMATLDALPAIARAVGQRMAVLVDGGVRRGVDVLKTRALGAQAAMIGRATVYGVAAAGEAGAQRALEILTDELLRAMRLCGARSVGEIRPELIAR